MNTVLELHDAAKKLGVSTSMMHRLVENGVIRASRTPRGFKLIAPADLDGLEITYSEIEMLIRSKQSAQSRKEHSNAQQPSNS